MRRLLLLTSGLVLVESVFFSALAPLLPHYADRLGLSKFQAGLLVGSYAAGALIAAVPAGLLASRLGVKLTALAGIGLLGVMSIVFGLAGSVWLLELARLGQGMGAALAWTGALAWLVSETPRERRGELIGLATAAAAGGALLGPAVGAAATVLGVRAVFLAIAVAAFALGAWGMRTPAPERGEGQSLRSMLAALRNPVIGAGLWLLALPSLMFGVLGVLVPLQLGRLGVTGTGIGAIFVIAAGFEAAASVVFGRWADRDGRGPPLRASLVSSVVLSLLLGWMTGAWTLSILVVLAATAYSAFFAPAMALLSDGAEQAGLEQALGFALLNLAWSPGHLIGSAGGGALADLAGEAGPYVVLAALCLATLLLLRRLLRSEPRKAVLERQASRA